MKRGILMACLIGLVAAVGARAADDSRPMRGGMNLVPPPVLEKLALTPDQKAKYDALDASFKKDVATWRSSNSSGGESGSGGSTNNVSSNRQGLRELHKSYMDQFRASLTSDQTGTLDKALENLRNNRGGHGGTNSPAKPPAPPTGT
jgi:hypothetical protein